jgi:hypothetical protein
MGRSIHQAAGLVEVLAGTRWALFDGVARLADARGPQGSALRSRLSELLAADEYVAGLKTGLQDLEHQAAELLASVQPPPPPPPGPGPDRTPGPPPPPPPIVLPPPAARTEVVDERATAVLRGAAAREALAALQRQLGDDPSLELTVSWRLVRHGAST